MYFWKGVHYIPANRRPRSVHHCCDLSGPGDSSDERMRMDEFQFSCHFGMAAGEQVGECLVPIKHPHLGGEEGPLPAC